jgi:DUF1365 family protein
MKRDVNAIYDGTVVHARVTPIRHRLAYRVFAVLFDCDGLERLDRRLRLFSYNRFNLFSLHDRDHGDGSPISAYLRRIASEAGLAETVGRFAMLCYPRILGYAFNPLTVYLGLDAKGRIRLVVYEVNNTFGERKTYVLPAETADGGLIAQNCAKSFYVSPFNTVEGVYSFRITPPGDDLTVGVALKNDMGPLLRAHFRGRRSDLSDTGLLHALFRTGWMTVKVIAGIHYEAARLWLKGLRTVSRPPPPEKPITYVGVPEKGS